MARHGLVVIVFASLCVVVGFGVGTRFGGSNAGQTSPTPQTVPTGEDLQLLPVPDPGFTARTQSERLPALQPAPARLPHHTVPDRQVVPELERTGSTTPAGFVIESLTDAKGLSYDFKPGQVYFLLGNEFDIAVKPDGTEVVLKVTNDSPLSKNAEKYIVPRGRTQITAVKMNSQAGDPSISFVVHVPNPNDLPSPYVNSFFIHPLGYSQKRDATTGIRKVWGNYPRLEGGGVFRNTQLEFRLFDNDKKFVQTLSPRISPTILDASGRWQAELTLPNFNADVAFHIAVVAFRVNSHSFSQEPFSFTPQQVAERPNAFTIGKLTSDLAGNTALPKTGTYLAHQPAGVFCPHGSISYGRGIVYPSG